MIFNHCVLQLTKNEGKSLVCRKEQTKEFMHHVDLLTSSLSLQNFCLPIQLTTFAIRLLTRQSSYVFENTLFSIHTKEATTIAKGPSSLSLIGQRNRQGHCTTEANAVTCASFALREPRALLSLKYTIRPILCQVDSTIQPSTTVFRNSVKSLIHISIQ